MKKLKELNMTEDQAVAEITFMRMFDKFLQRELGKQYADLANKFARQLTEEELRRLGATEEEIKEACDYASKCMLVDGLIS